VIIYNSQYPNGTVLVENYIPESTRESMDKIYRYYYFPRTKVPSDSYFVMGDNRTNSMDSRAIGTIKSYAMLGKEGMRIGNFEKNNGNPVSTSQIFSIPKYTFGPISSEQEKAIYQAKLLK
jgi:hypothetical protein